ncbi:MAG: dihydroneopterin aldolase [Micropruina sp.]|nr:MAG: dihydroneopterin aldolase [Micropruina sp.]
MRANLDRIALRGIRVEAIHGVYDVERVQPQRFVIDATCWLVRPATGDDLATTVDYARLAEALADDVRRDPVDLIETLAERLAARCLADPLVAEAEITVHKPDAAIGVPFDDVGVTIRRSRPA